VIGAIRPRPASAVLVLAVLLALLGPGVALVHPGTHQAPQQHVVAAPVHAAQLGSRDHGAWPRALVGRDHRQASVSTSTLVMVVVATLLSAVVAARRGGWWPAAAAAACGRPRRAWSRAPPCHLQPA
jgi:hypothetical protein